MTPIPLSVLDLSPVPSGGTVAGALGNSVESFRAGEGAMPYPSPAEAARHVWTDDERTLVADRAAICGSPSTVSTAPCSTIRPP